MEIKVTFRTVSETAMGIENPVIFPIFGREWGARPWKASEN